MSAILDAIPPLQKLVVALTAILVLLFMLALVRVMNNKDNDLEWAQLISTRGADGQQYADWDKVGKGLGVVLCVWLPAVYVYSPKMEAMGLAAVMGIALAYLGGVSGYAATLRAKQGSVETTKIREIADAVKTTETRTETK